MRSIASRIARLKNPHLLIPTGIIFLALILRFYHFGTFPFGFDQVQILENAEKIKNLDLTLIGPRTGPAEMFTGPLIYYLTALWWLVIPSPIASLLITTATIVLATGIIIYFLTNWIFDRQKALVILGLWAFSPFLVAMDRIAWNPNLTILASSLVFLAVYRLLGKATISLTKNWFELLLIMIGSFLGYQAHFSGLLLPALVVCAFLLTRKKGLWPILATGIGLAGSLLPTLLFDIKHNWLNVRGLLALAQHGQDSLLIDRIKSVFITADLSLSTLGRILFWNTNATLLLVGGLLLVGMYLAAYPVLKRSVNKAAYWLPMIWLVISILAYSLYKGDKPEYYFLLVVPAGLLMLMHLISIALKTFQQQILALGILAIYSGLLVVNTYQPGTGVNLENQLAVRDYVLYLPKDSISKLVYDMRPVDAVGLQYLLKSIELSSTGTPIHLEYPLSKNELSNFNAYDVGVWRDNRDFMADHYITHQSYILGIPITYDLYQVTYPNTIPADTDIYKILQGGRSMADLWVMTDSDNKDTYQRALSEVDNQIQLDQIWTEVSLNGQNGLIYRNNQALFFLPYSTYGVLQTKQLSQQLQIIN